MSKPTIICVPGSWHSPEVYESTFRNLRGHGYETVGVPLASNGAVPAHENFDGDVKIIKDALGKYIDSEGKEVVLVTHSYSGLPASEASAGFGRTEREAKGLEGGIIRIASIASFVVPEGFELVGEFPAWMKVDHEKGFVTVSPEDAKEIFYNDLSQAEADKWIVKLVHESVGVYGCKVTYAPWRTIPSMYIIGAKDNSVFSREAVNAMIANARKENPKALDVVEVCPGGGHCLMISHPEWLADVLRRAAGEEV